MVKTDISKIVLTINNDKFDFEVPVTLLINPGFIVVEFGEQVAVAFLLSGQQLVMKTIRRANDKVDVEVTTLAHIEKDATQP